MKCWIGDPNTHCKEAEFIGLHVNKETGDVAAVLRFKGHGMYVEMLHPSKVMMSDPRGESNDG